MSLAGITPQQKFPGAVVADLRQYASDLGLPADWFKQVTSTEAPFQGLGKIIKFSYKGAPLAAYQCDLFGEIENRYHHMPVPPKTDPLVIATQLEMSQPTDPQWRRFKHLVFRPADVAYVNNVSQKGIENGADFSIAFRDGKTLLCGNERDYEGTGLSTYEWFLEYVMQFDKKSSQCSHPS